MAKDNEGVLRRTEKLKSERLGFGSFELPEDSSYSRKKFRTAFIRAVDNLERDVSTTLYKKAFFQFVRLVWSQFPQAIPQPISARLEDKGLFAELERVIGDFTASPYNDTSASIHPAFIELLLPVFNRERELLINHPRGILMRELFRPLRELSEEVPRAFPNQTALSKIKSAEPLREILAEWSQYWNLDMDWCRDYAVAALCDWLTDRYFQWQSDWGEGRLSLRPATFAVQHENIWTAPVELSLLPNEASAGLLSLLAQDFVFRWREVDFRYHRWNPLSRYRDEWERECEEEFKDYLAQRREGGVNVTTGAVRRFRVKRGEYVRMVDQAAEQAGLVRTPRRWADEHLTWAVRFQVQKWPLSKIEKTYSKPRKTISDGVNRLLSFIDLPRRPDLPPGMPRGTRLRSRRRIVRN